MKSATIRSIGLLLLSGALSACQTYPRDRYPSGPFADESLASAALDRLGDLLRVHGVPATHVTSPGFLSEVASGEVPTHMTTTLMSAANHVGSAIRPVAFNPILEDWIRQRHPELGLGGGGSLAALLGTPEPAESEAGAPSRIRFRDPDVILVGAISGYDQGIEKAKEGFEIQASHGDADASTELGREAVATRVTVTLDMVSFRELAYLPKVQATNTMVLFEERKSGGFGVAYQGSGIWANAGYVTKDGVHTALRTLVELSVLEVLGECLAVPYWRCAPDVVRRETKDALLTSMLRELNEMPDTEFHDLLLKPYLFVQGFPIDLGVTGVTAADQVAIQHCCSFYGEPDSRRMWLKLWESLPFEGAAGDEVAARWKQARPLLHRDHLLDWQRKRLARLGDDSATPLDAMAARLLAEPKAASGAAAPQ